MPLVAHRNLDSLRRIKEEGWEVLDIQRANSQEIRELHIGLLNMMPDGALLATERQFLRLISSANKIAQFYVHIFTVSGIPRSPEMKKYIAENYERFEDLKNEGLDAIIVTGTNPIHQNLSEELYWSEVKEVFDWAHENVVSILCSCLASHLALHHFHNLTRQCRLQKRFGVFSQRVLDDKHPLVANINTRFDMPHSRWNNVAAESLRQNGLRILVSDQNGDFALATSADGLRQVYFQGHPEYDKLSLLKEFKRDLQNFFAGKTPCIPNLPTNYFTPYGVEIFENYLNKRTIDHKMPFPEDALINEIDVTWRDTAKALFANWLGFVYQLTHYDRKKQFMDGVNPNNPLELI